MLQSAWLFIGTVAILSTAGALLVSDNALAIITGVLGFVSWGMFAYGSLEVVIVTQSTVFTYTLPSVTMFSVMAALVPGYVALTGPVEVVDRVRRGDAQEL